MLAAALELGQLYQAMTRLDDAIVAFDAAERAACEQGDREAQINAICSKASTLFFCKKSPTEARKEGERAFELAKAVGSETALASTEFILACTQWCAGEIAEADALFDRAIAVLRRSGPPLLTVAAVSFRGSTHAMLSQYDDAEREMRWAQSKAQELGASYASYDRLRSLMHLARIHGNRGRISDGLDVLAEAALLAERVGNRNWPGRLLNTQAWLHCEAQNLETALALDKEAARLAKDAGDVEAECNSHINVARDWILLGEPDQAFEHLSLSNQIQSSDFWFWWVYYPRLQGELAAYWIAKGDLEQAAKHAAVSLEGKSSKRRAWGYKLQGDIAVLEDRLEDAQREYDSALHLVEEIPCPTIEWRILQAAADLAGGPRDALTRARLRGRARAILQSMALSIRDKELRKTFLASEAVRRIESGV